MIPSALNLPAQTFHSTLPILTRALSHIPILIFHCSSSRGRGPRCAGWYADAIADQPGGELEQKVYVLQGGIVEWIEQYPDQVVSVP